MTTSANTLAAARLDFVSQWGALGSAWGVNRTMAMLHALLLTSAAPLSTDDAMETLQISRGNASTNLRELVAWGLSRKVVLPGERRDYYEAEKDVWRIFCTVARERKRREIDPAIEVLRSCAEKTAGLRSREARQFHRMMKALGEFAELLARVMDRVAASERSKVVPAVLKLFK